MENYKLTSIKEARLMRRSNSGFEFKPIKLKSLQEARNEKKSSSTRKFSLNPNDLTSISKTEKSPSLKISSSKPLIKPAFRNPLANLSKQVHKKTKSAITNPSPINSHHSSITSTAKIPTPLNICSKKLIKKPNISQSTPQKTAIKSKVSSKPAKSSSSRSLSKTKNISILDVLSNKNKKLKKDQEQGLITRLQGKNLIKFY